MMHSRKARHDVTLEMDESIFAEDLINAATLSGLWEKCKSNAGKLQQVACACCPFRRLQLQALGVSGANVESDAMSNQFLKLAAVLQHVDTHIVPLHSLS
eukprot:362278-Chlamydomonas_euryale.AAC.3